eukprot:scaffold98426_cov70-Attheya_sp.AAC.5
MVNISSQNPNMLHHTFNEQLNVNDNTRSDTSTVHTSGNGPQSSSDGSFHHPTIGSSADHQPHLFQYVMQMKWKKLCRRPLLKRKKGDYIEMCKASDSTGLLLFSFAIASGAPNDVLDAILKRGSDWTVESGASLGLASLVMSFVWRELWSSGTT